MERSYNAADVICPFYRDDDCRERKIRCEGLIEGVSSCTHYFRLKKDYELQLKVFCCKHFDKCEWGETMLVKQELQDKVGVQSLNLRPESEADVAYKGYGGTRRFVVEHPEMGAVKVAAPDSTSALFAAASLWNMRWQSEDFYTRCQVEKLRKVGKKMSCDGQEHLELMEEPRV